MDKGMTIKNQMNKLGGKGVPFVFLVDFLMEHPLIFGIKENKIILWKTPKRSNFPATVSKKLLPTLKYWHPQPVSYEVYCKGFDMIMRHILNGDTYLLNFTQPTFVDTNLSPEEIFLLSRAPYKIYLKDKFVCFSPEPFIRIENGKIASFPMKGTIEAGDEKADEQILTNTKELAEHNTIVDLIRNDLSIKARNVKVEQFRYLERIHTHQKDLWQVSSRITGDLPANYPSFIGDILFGMLPAGSVSGAPKKKTLEIIRAAEGYERGYYTGVFGVFDGENLDSCVLIRYLENENGKPIYKSGGGITFLSKAEDEYTEMIKKVYVPLA